MFSIVIPYYKKRKYIERCLDSVVEQTYKYLEIILVDDGSEDDIEKLISNRYPGKVKLIQQHNQGVSAARNSGITNASHDYIAFLDADDYWSPFYLEKVAEVITREKEVKILGTQYSRNRDCIELKNDRLKYLKVENYFKSAVTNTLFLTSATIIRRSFFISNQGFNVNLKRGEDIDVWLRAVVSGGKVVYIKNCLVYYSPEDKHQATRVLSRVEYTLVGKINQLYASLIENSNDTDFKKFISKYVYFNLYPYYFNLQNHFQAKIVLSKTNNYYFFLHLPYYLPLSVGRKIVANKKLSRYLRLYLKFFLRKIYK